MKETPNKSIQDVVEQIMKSAQCPEHREGKTRFLATDEITSLVQNVKDEERERIIKITRTVAPSLDSEEYSDSVKELECFQDGFDDCSAVIRKSLSNTPES